MNISIDDFMKSKPRRSSSFYFSEGDILEYDNNLLKIISKYHKEKEKYYTVKCLKCNGIYDVREGNIWHKRGCPYCKNKKVLIGFNDIATTNPLLMTMMKDKNNAFRYVEKSYKKIDWVCPNCGEYINNKSIFLVNKAGLHCPKCDDGISLPNRIMYNILSQCNIDFEREKLFEEIPYKKYDFYIPEWSLIIEMQGGFHKLSKFDKEVSSVISNDIYKKKRALEIGIKEYIQIDADESDFSYIYQNIKNSRLKKYINFDKIDSYKCYSDSIQSVIPKICNKWNNSNATIEELSKEYKLHIATIGRYLKIGNELHLCSYVPNDGIRRAKSKIQNKIRCINNDRIFNSAKEAAKWANLKSRSGIYEVCNGKRKYYGKDKNGNHLKWEYA